MLICSTSDYLSPVDCSSCCLVPMKSQKPLSTIISKTLCPIKFELICSVFIDSGFQRFIPHRSPPSGTYSHRKKKGISFCDEFSRSQSMTKDEDNIQLSSYRNWTMIRNRPAEHWQYWIIYIIRYFKQFIKSFDIFFFQIKIYICRMTLECYELIVIKNWPNYKW